MSSALKASNKRKVLCIQPIHEVGMAILRSRPDIELIVPESQEPSAWMPLLCDVEAIVVRLSQITAEVIAAAPKLQLVSRHGVGVDNIDVAAATKAGVIVATVGLANAPSVAEQTLMMILALAKRTQDFDRAVRTGEYTRKFKLEAIDIAGKSILIVGLGRIGSRVAAITRAVGMVPLGLDPAFSAEQIRALGCEPVMDLHTALPRVDFLTVHVPLEPATRGMIGVKELARMKPSAYVINCARGGIVDEAALLDALNSGRLKGAGLDVQATEPPAMSDPLLACERILLAPHSAATTVEGMQRMATNVAQNVLDQFDGRLPESHIFNPEVRRA
jgi:D-3-phosphoglycerate dehydrogenase / 2-oxoglutarate reductase